MTKEDFIAHLEKQGKGMDWLKENDFDLFPCGGPCDLKECFGWHYSPRIKSAEEMEADALKRELFEKNLSMAIDPSMVIEGELA